MPNKSVLCYKTNITYSSKGLPGHLWDNLVTFLEAYLTSNNSLEMALCVKGMWSNFKSIIFILMTLKVFQKYFFKDLKENFCQLVNIKKNSKNLPV